MPPLLALVIVTHNSADFLPQLAQSWHTAVGGILGLSDQIETHIADSGSADNSRDLAKILFPSAKLYLCQNIGYGAAGNIAIRASTAPWILLCNPDLSFSPDFAKNLLAPILQNPSAPFAPHKKIAAIAPRLLNPDGSPQPSVGQFPTLASLLRDQFRPRPNRKYIFPQPTAPGPIDWATGACLLLNRNAFVEVGGVDEKYFLYGEELDLQRRFHDAGYANWFLPTATVTHLNPNAARSPRPQAQHWAARGSLRYFAKFSGPLTLTAFRLLALASFRLPPSEALASRRKILDSPTGP
jgi:N-acetylglucosaminyl-diphospho-decaprenol L-rhamnosyltransferase